MRAANDRGYDCVLVEDGTGSYFPAFKESVLKQVVAQDGIIGWSSVEADHTNAYGSDRQKTGR